MKLSLSAMIAITAIGCAGSDGAAEEDDSLMHATALHSGTTSGKAEGNNSCSQVPRRLIDSGVCVVLPPPTWHAIGFTRGDVVEGCCSGMKSGRISCDTSNLGQEIRIAPWAGFVLEKQSGGWIQGQAATPGGFTTISVNGTTNCGCQNLLTNVPINKYVCSN